MQSKMYVALQFICLGLLAVSTPLHNVPTLWFIVFGLGFALGIWAMISMRLNNLSIMPELLATAQLTVHGPYRWIRHPMYTALAICSLAWVMVDPRLWRWLVLAILLMDLWLKARYEEQLLIQRFPNYAAYQQRTKRFIPWLV